MIILGVMSGSSLDGLDMAVVAIEGRSFDLLHAVTAPLPPSLILRLKKYADLSVAEYILLERDYTDFVAEAVNDFLTAVSSDVALIGLHGHTVAHIPAERITVQLGNGGRLASLTNIDVITDFRIQDVAKGGEGTPLASLVDLHLFKGYDCYLNLGGIANITNVTDTDPIAYDICPCNQLLNFLSNKFFDLPYDDGGSIARKGNIQDDITIETNKIEYWAQAPPKSLDNNWIKNEFLPLASLAGDPTDVLATMTDWVASQIAANIPPRAKKVLVTGGGAYNNFLLELIEEKSGTQLTVPTKHIVDYKESILMAYLAYCRLEGQQNVLRAVTKASSDSIAGAHYKA